MNRTLWAAVIAATALTATAADARMAAKHHRSASGGDAAAMAKTRDLNSQQLASASGAGGPQAASPGMTQGSGPAPMANEAPAGPSAAPEASAPMTPTTETMPPADPAAPADGSAPMDSSTPPR